MGWRSGGKFPSPNVSETKVNATFFKDGSSLPELCHPALSAFTTWLRESREPEKHLEHKAHSFNTRARCQAALQPFTHRQPTRVCGGEDCLSAPPPCPRRSGSHLSAVSRKGQQGRARVRKAAVQQAAGRFLDQLLRHVTVVRRTLRTGDLVCASQVPLRHHKPRTGNLPCLSVSRWAVHGISASS